MKYTEFYKLLNKYLLITPIWYYELELIDKELLSDSNDDYLNLFSIYFCLINSGNVCMSLNKKELNDKFDCLLNDSLILSMDKYSDIDLLNEEFNIIRDESKKIINKRLSSIKDLNIVKESRIFVVDNNYLYLRKYYIARLSIINSINRIYSEKTNYKKEFRIIDILKDSLKNSFSLSLKQDESVKKGLNRSLVITGGPGTGKTTSIVFILLNILYNNLDYNIYLAASSGKASSRMKESINNNLEMLDKSKIDPLLLGKINGSLKDDSGKKIEEFTIHRLLGVDKNGCFKYNKNNQFEANSIFVIDEASMIDVCMFSNLLEAIPTGAKVFILGDKDQLPSVEVGSVFSDLILYDKIKDNVVFLDESKRFKKGTKIYDLAYKVNNGLDLGDISFLDVSEFKLDKRDFSSIKKECPIYYYLNDGINQKDKIKNMLCIWFNEYYSNIKKVCQDLTIRSNFDNIYGKIEEAKILSSENNGIRGVFTLNQIIKSGFKCNDDYFEGLIMMVNKNNKALELYNGDTGILVSFFDDNNLYFMIKKTTERIKNDGYVKDEIFKINGYIFYPFRMITKNEIDLAFAITVHKSQGSDYKNILVVLPTAKGHPLLNRQILYTAITRTKGTTYIFSNLDRLNEAKDRILIRDTNIK